MSPWLWYHHCLGCRRQTKGHWPYVSLLRIVVSSDAIPLARTSVAVFGCGAIGLGVISTASLVGASRIIAVDINPNKESWAKKFGAHEFINPSTLPQGKKIQDYLVEITDGGLDYTFDCTGNVSIASYCTFRSLTALNLKG